MKRIPTIDVEASPNAGALLARLFKEKRTRKSVLARMLGVLPTAVINYQKKATMQTETLWKLSTLLKHNFFLDIADQLPKDFSTYANIDTTLQDRIAALEEEVKLLKAQNEVLERVLKR